MYFGVKQSKAKEIKQSKIKIKVQRSSKELFAHLHMNCSSFQVQHLFNCDSFEEKYSPPVYSKSMLIIPFLTLDSKTDCAQQPIAMPIT